MPRKPPKPPVERWKARWNRMEVKIRPFIAKESNALMRETLFRRAKDVIAIPEAIKVLDQKVGLSKKQKRQMVIAK